MKRLSLGISTSEILLNIFFWLLFTLIGIFIPTLLVFIILRYLGLFNNWNIFFLNGEFAIYSNSLFMYTLFIASKDWTKNNFFLRPLFVSVSIIGLILSTGIYCGVIFSDLINFADYNINVDNSFLINFTIGIFIVSVLISLGSNIFENMRLKISAEGIKKAKDADYVEFEKKFDNNLNKLNK
jgi:hypothetical protein